MNIKLIYGYEDVTGKQSKPVSVVLENDVVRLEDARASFFSRCDAGEFFAPDDLGLPTTYFDSVAENPETYFHLHQLIDVQETEQEATHGSVLTLLGRWMQHHAVGWVGRGE